MAISNHERVGRVLKLLHEGLYPYFEREMESAYTQQWSLRPAAYFNKDNTEIAAFLKDDLYSFLKFMWQEWNDVFRKTLGKAERSLLSECQDIRNTWAHSSTFTTDDAYRALDTVGRLLAAVSAPQADQVEKQKQELMRLRYEDQARRETRRAAVAPTDNPGDALKELFNKYAPVLILIDEWVAYARQLHDKSDLPAGNFDTHFTFAQTLSESAKNARDTLLVVSIPSSDIEIGGDRGKDALDRLKNAIGRVESSWRPASAEESFEIVRRRLFQTTADPSLFVQRDAVVKALQYLAWKSIFADREALNLDVFQSNQATTKRNQSNLLIGERKGWQSATPFSHFYAA